MNDDVMARLKVDIAKHLDAILEMFKPGAKISCFIRSPGKPERDVVLTTESDDMAEVVRMIHMARKRKAL